MVGLKRLIATVAASALLLPAAWAQGSGRIEGTVTREDNRGLGGVSVVVAQLGLAELTDSEGRYRFASVPAGTYTVTFSLGEDQVNAENVEVQAGGVATVDRQVDWNVSFAETITVVSASRRTERIVEAPAAVTLVTEDEIERQASHGQLPKLLEFTPGAEVTQSGLYDFNLNTRGFNSSLNRRVAVLIDGRDPSVAFLGSQEWSALSIPLDDVASLEMVRGPSAALYGANASSGVVNLVTKQPRYSRGGQVRLTGGELSTFNGDLRYATGLGGEWYLKLIGGVRNSGDYTLSRNGRAEYAVPCTVRGQVDCLPQEAVALDPFDNTDIFYGDLRLDKYFGASVLTFEGGMSDVKGPVQQTGIGRVQARDSVESPWARVNFNTNHLNVLAFYTGRDAPKQTALSAGTNLALDSTRYSIEAQTNWGFAGDKVRLVVGGSYTDEEIDSFDPDQGVQTLLFAPVESEREALFGQLDWQVSDRVKVVLAGRWDDSTLYDAQFSPKGSVVFGINSNNSLRLTYNEAFQTANYSEYFLQANAAPPVNLRAIEPICAAAGISCGFSPGPTRVLALGNEDLELEEVKTWEIGYSGILNGKSFLTVDYYRSENENFITDLLPQVGTPLGRINPNFGAYRPPANLPAPLAALLLGTLQRALGPSFALLSNNLDGRPILAAVSYTNFGDVDTQGIDLGLNHYFNNEWSATFNYSWFDFDPKDELPGFTNLLLPNSPENKFSGGLGYTGERWDFNASLRWSDEFRWSVGPFQGDVESYTSVDIGGNFRLNDHVSFGINVSNLFDEEHWQAFGGDLLGRRALGHVVLNW